MDQKTLIKFLGSWITNSLLLAIFSAIFSSNIVLGNASLAKSAASVIAGFILTIVIYFVPQIAKKMELKLKDEKVTALAYFIADAIVLWIIKRFADITGLGISSILFVAVLAIFAAIVQVAVDKYSVKFLKKLDKQ